MKKVLRKKYLNTTFRDNLLDQLPKLRYKL